MIIFNQTPTYSYRDPAAYIEDGKVYLFFTLVENTEDRQYFYVAMSRSADFVHWTEPKNITEKSHLKNYSSPGNIIFACKPIQEKRGRFMVMKLQEFLQ